MLIAYKIDSMKKRIIENWKSTLLGAVILAGSFTLVGMKIITWAEAIGFITLSGLLAWVQDSVFKVKT